MNVYMYDPSTGLLLGQTDAPEDQLDPGQFLLPAFSTIVAPPKAEDGYDIVYLEGAWKYQNSNAPTPPETVPTPTTGDVDAERDKRVSGGISFQGAVFQTRPDDRENIAGASTAALGAIVAGAKLNDYRWANPKTDFAWIDESNKDHLMDAHTMFEFGQAAMAWKQANIFAARAIKDQLIAGKVFDITDNSLWPTWS